LIVLLHQIFHPAHRSYCLRSTCGSLYKKTPAGGALYYSKTTDINQNNTNTTNLNTIWGRTEGSKEGKKELYLHGSILVVTSNN
jgi:hypothetical protein